MPYCEVPAGSPKGDSRITRGKLSTRIFETQEVKGHTRNCERQDAARDTGNNIQSNQVTAKPAPYPQTRIAPKAR